MQKFFVFLVFTLCLLIPIRPVCGADSTTFNPTTVAVIAKGTSSIPVGTIISWPVAQNPADWQNSDGSYNWLECNGQSISKTVYPELFAAVGSRTPDFRSQFLRGLDTGHSVGERVQDTFKSHVHGQPAHTHSWNGQLASTALTGTAAGQKYVDASTNITPSGPGGLLTTGSGKRTDYYYHTTTTRTASSSAVTGRLNNGTANGTVSSSWGDDTYATGNAETAPKHVYVRYLIRARP